MARNGSGSYSNPYPNFVSGTVISSSQVDANNTDIAAALTQSIAVDGQSTVTGNIPLSTNKLTGVGAGSAATDSLNLSQAQAEAMHWCGTAGGSANAITLSPSPAITAYAAGQRFVWKASGSVNTGATTVAISGLGTIALQDSGAALVGGDHAAGKIYMGILDTTSTVQIINVQVSSINPLRVTSLVVSGTATVGGILSVDDTTTSTSGTTGSIHTDGGLGVAGTAFVAGTAKIVGVTTHGGNVVSDTDSTDDLGTTSVRWKDLFVDAITATDQVTATGFTGTLDGILGSGSASAATVTTLTGTTITASTAFVPDASDGAALGTTALEFSDLFLADGAVISFGDDQDVNITHIPDVGIRINGAKQIQFDDDSQYIRATSATAIQIAAADEIDLTATTIDINGAVALNGAITGATNITLSGELDAATLDISGNADIDGITNLDAVDIDGAVQIDATLSVGVDGTGYDVTFYGDTASRYVKWDESADSLIFTDTTKAVFGADSDSEIYHDGSNMYIKNDTGNTLAYSDTFQFFSHTGSELFAQLNHNSAVKLYFDSSLKFETTATGANVTGLLGIGISPAARLHVKQASQNIAGGLRIERSDTTGHSGIHQGADSFLYVRNTENGGINWHTNNALTMTLGADGSLGIGDATPAVANGIGLQIHNSGSTQSRISMTTAASGAAGTDGFQIGAHSNGTDAFIENRENGLIDFATNSQSRMQITAAGAVTIAKAVTNGTDAGDTRFIMNSANQYTLQFKNAGNVAGHIGGGGADVLRFSNAAGATTMQATSGNWTKPLQPAFLVHPNARINNVTGDNTEYTVVWNDEIFDQGGDFASNTFTAPVAGKYQFDVGISLLGIVSGMTTMIVALVTHNRTIRLHFKANVFAQTGAGDQNSFNGSVMTDMDASDTATIRITVAGGAKVVDLDGVDSNNYATYWSGALIA